MSASVSRDRDVQLPLIAVRLRLEHLVREASHSLGKDRSAPVVVRSPWLHEQTHGVSEYPTAYAELLDSGLTPGEVARRLRGTGWRRVPRTTQRREGVTALDFAQHKHLRLRIWIADAASKGSEPLRGAIATATRISEEAGYAVPAPLARVLMLHWLAEWAGASGPMAIEAYRDDLRACHSALSVSEQRAAAEITSATRRPRSLGRAPGPARQRARCTFRGLELQIDPDVFTPYPISEKLVDAALRNTAHIPSPTLVDVGTGSGAIALAYAAERPDSRVFAIDTSKNALALCDTNRRTLGLSNVIPRLGSLLDPVRDLAQGTVHGVCANVPYVPRDLAIIAETEGPAGTVFGPGEDGLDLLRALARDARSVLARGGFLTIQLISLQWEGFVEEVQRLGYQLADSDGNAHRTSGAVVRTLVWSGEVA